MPPFERDVLPLPRGDRSREAASFMAQLDRLSENLAHQVPRLAVRELEWQPAPGTNTIGVLLAHMAVVGVWWTESGLRGQPVAEVDFRGAPGFGAGNDGTPLGPRDGHPAALRGRPHAFYRTPLARSRAHLRDAVRGLTDRDLARPRRRVRRDGATHHDDARWLLFHLVEHFAGHFGQILLLRHARRALRR
uniref:DUF664 domain-containing protein n=1 Tax=Eiseniibacteriota bacterium TaxID=2212470 RepID=A0A832MK61_UNCEI